jgi:putative transposase
MGIRSTAHARYEIWYHIIWGTKYRKKIIKAEWLKEDIKRLFRKIAMQYDIEIKEIEVLEDHIHILATAPPRIAPSRIVQIIKSTSTKIMFERHRWLKKYYWGGQIWEAGYFVRSVGVGLTAEQIEKYIKEQSEA